MAIKRVKSWHLALRQRVIIRLGGCIQNVPVRMRTGHLVDSEQYFDHVDIAANSCFNFNKNLRCLRVSFFFSQVRAYTERSDGFSTRQSSMKSVVEAFGAV